MAVQMHITVAEFDRLAQLPENADKRLEFIGGEVVEVVTNNYASKIAARILSRISIYVEEKDLGDVTGADGGYRVSGERYIPDAAYISRKRQPTPSHETYNPNSPDLAVEVVSPTDQPKDITDKVANYLAANCVVWVVYPEKQQTKVYEPGQSVKTVGIDGTLDGGVILPGFKLTLKDIFK
jgi:Uma2 family endonuclease